MKLFSSEFEGERLLGSIFSFGSCSPSFYTLFKNLPKLCSLLKMSFFLCFTWRIQCETSLRKRCSNLDLDWPFESGLSFHSVIEAFLSSIFLVSLSQEANTVGFPACLGVVSLHQIYYYLLLKFVHVPYTFSYSIQMVIRGT